MGDDLTEYAPNETLQRSVTATGTTDTLADYSQYRPDTIENYAYVTGEDDYFSDATGEYVPVETATILADGSLVVRLFYKLLHRQPDVGEGDGCGFCCAERGRGL